MIKLEWNTIIVLRLHVLHVVNLAAWQASDSESANQRSRTQVRGSGYHGFQPVNPRLLSSWHWRAAPDPATLTFESAQCQCASFSSAGPAPRPFRV